MNDDEIALRIKQGISANNGLVEIPIQEFGQVWFKGKKVKDKDFTKKMLDFTEKYELKYITILTPKLKPIAIRFWQTELLEEKNECIETDQ